MIPCGPIRGRVRPPGSKSITNRALVCAALASGRSLLQGALQSEDTEVMIRALNQLGAKVHWREPAELEVVSPGPKGLSSPQESPLEIFVGNSGTTIRFLTAMLSTLWGCFRLDGVPRMRQRPIGPLALALRQLGTDVRTQDGFPPVEIRASGLPGGQASLSGEVSSQFLSGLLMAAPVAQGSVRLKVHGPLVSQPYVKMTWEVMRAFGVEVEHRDWEHFWVRPQTYRPQVYEVEPDASAASYFFAAAAISQGHIMIEGLHRGSLQGDVRFVDLLARMGCLVQWHPDRIEVQGGPLHGIEADMNAISDTVPTLAVVALFAQGPTTITGIGHIRHKETDRIRAVAQELRKLGAQVEEGPDWLRIHPPQQVRGARIATYQDHRMAMSFALVGLRVAGLEVEDPECVNKTYPEFFQHLESLCSSQG